MKTASNWRAAASRSFAFPDAIHRVAAAFVLQAVHVGDETWEALVERPGERQVIDYRAGRLGKPLPGMINGIPGGYGTNITAATRPSSASIGTASTSPRTIWS